MLSTWLGNVGPRLGLVISSSFSHVADEVTDVRGRKTAHPSGTHWPGRGMPPPAQADAISPHHRFHLTLQSLSPPLRALGHLTVSSKNKSFLFQDIVRDFKHCT